MNNIIKQFAKLSLLFIALTGSINVNAETIAVIAHPDMQEQLDANSISRIFLGKSNNFPSGDPVIAIDLADGNPAREKFQKLVLRKSDAQLKSYWAKQIFTAQGTPPKSTDNVEKLLLLVSKNPSVITYVPLDMVPDTVKIVAKF